MAIISFTNYKRGQTTGCMGAVMRYTMQNKKTECDGQQLVTGINCQPESVYADFMTTKRLHHKTDGVLFYHMVQSFPKGEAVDPVTAHAAALKLAEYYEGYEVLVCTHTDREHIHSHFLINSVNFDTGKKLHIAKEQLQELRQRNDQVCMEFSLPVFRPADRKQKTKTMTIGEYHTAARGQSKKLQLMNIINDCMRHASSRCGATSFLRNSDKIYEKKRNASQAPGRRFWPSAAARTRTRSWRPLWTRWWPPGSLIVRSVGWRWTTRPTPCDCYCSKWGGM